MIALPLPQVNVVRFANEKKEMFSSFLRCHKKQLNKAIELSNLKMVNVLGVHKQN